MRDEEEKLEELEWSWLYPGYLIPYARSYEEVTHSGDKADSFNIEAERFDHYSRTWASWQHSAFLIQAVSCSMAQAAYVAMVNQSKKDLAIESGGRSAFQSFGCSEGVVPPSPRNNRP